MKKKIKKCTVRECRNNDNDDIFGDCRIYDDLRHCKLREMVYRLEKQNRYFKILISGKK